MYDVIIIGAGFAGYSAAIYTVRYNLKTLIIASEPGGVVVESFNVENYPGFRSITGLELMQKFEHQAKDLGTELIVDEVVGITKHEDQEQGQIFKVHTHTLNTYDAKAIIIASGTKKKKLDIPGQELYDGKGVHYCATCDAPFYKKKIAAVVGGANSAVHAADLLRKHAAKVYLIYRGAELRAEPLMKDQVLADPKVEVIYNTNVKEYKGKEFIETLHLDKAYHGSHELKIDGVFIEIGGLPSSKMAQKLGVIIGDTGEILVNEKCETNVPGIFGAGDVTNTVLRQGVVAASMGAIAATTAYNYISGKKVGSNWK
jgi:thioredoxin reductase (NADPH)